MDDKKRPEVIPGYVHPESNNYNKKGVYKTFNEESKKKPFGVTTVGKSYAKQNTVVTEKCPKCEAEVINSCYCSYSDRKCENGHIWYVDRDGNIKEGDPHMKK